MKKSNDILIKTGFLLFLLSVVLLFPMKAKAATYQEVPTMAYLKVEGGQAYISYANAAAQLFYKPANGETVRLTQKVCTGAWTDKQIFYYTSGNQRVPTKVSLYKYTIKTGKTEKLCTLNKKCNLVGYSKNSFHLHTTGTGKQYLYKYNLKTKKMSSKRIEYPVYNKKDSVYVGSMFNGRYILVNDLYTGYNAFVQRYYESPSSIYILDLKTQKFKLISKMITALSTKETSQLYYAKLSGTASNPYSQIWKYNVKTGKNSVVSPKYEGVIYNFYNDIADIIDSKGNSKTIKYK